MERTYGYWGNLSDDDIRAFEYEADQIHKAGEFRIGKYERDYTIEDVLMRGSYEIGDRYMRIYDPVWGEEYIGDKPYDELLIELARTPLFRRLQSIEQLTLGPDYATMPNSMYFSRWEHIWGSLTFVRKMTESRADITDRQRMVLQLRTLLSDTGHTAFSHLGDWMFQGVDGGEDLHDQDLKDILRASGVEDILTRFGFSLEETVFPDVHDWVECPSPGLCVDRVDYGIREILRWGSPTIPLNMCLQELHNPQSVFEITDDGQLIFKNAKIARYYAAGFSLLATEHWSHPVHRLQEQLFQSAVRSSVVSKVMSDNIHPREVLYGIDSDFYAHFQTWPMLHLQKVMKDIAVTQRKIFIEGRRADLNHMFANIRSDEWEFPAFPDPLRAYTWQSQYFAKPYPPNIRLKEVANISGHSLELGRDGLLIDLPPFKARAVDPPVRLASGEVRRLSEIEPSYGRYLAEQRAMMAKTYRATVLMRSDVARKIVEEHHEAEKVWPTLLKRPRSPRNLVRIIRDVEIYAAAHSFDIIRETTDHELEQQRKLGHQGVLFGL